MLLWNVKHQRETCCLVKLVEESQRRKLPTEGRDEARSVVRLRPAVLIKDFFCFSPSFWGVPPKWLCLKGDLVKLLWCWGWKLNLNEWLNNVIKWVVISAAQTSFLISFCVIVVNIQLCSLAARQEAVAFKSERWRSKFSFSANDWWLRFESKLGDHGWEGKGAAGVQTK